MHGAWGALSILIKKQQSNKLRKDSLRYKLQKKKESYLNKHTKDNFDFPELTTAEMKILKDKIRSDYKKEKIKSISTNLVLFATAFCILFLILKSLMRF